MASEPKPQTSNPETKCEAEMSNSFSDPYKDKVHIGARVSHHAHTCSGLLALALVVAVGVFAEPVVPSTLSRYQRILLALQTQEGGWKASFADAALSQLVEIYLAEADLAMFQAGEKNPNPKLYGWSRAVEQYANQLVRVQEDIKRGLPVALYVDVLGPPRIVIGGRSVILNHPREDQQRVYEAIAVTDFCRRRDCDSLIKEDTEPTPIPMSAPVTEPDWRFTRAGPVCAGHSVEVHFDSRADLSRVKPLCRQLLQELAALQNDLSWQQRHGVHLDWDFLETRAIPEKPVHLVTLNDLGDSLLLAVPFLHDRPGLLRDVTPWLVSQQSGDQPTLLILKAENYGWK
ncbi:MAG: hypothetical protein ACJAYC_003654 [Halieaceae bacterium]|jgi:hypothetical protein